jgi:hypothetical protein
MQGATVKKKKTRNLVNPKCLYRELRENKNLLSLPGIEQNFFGCPARILVPTPPRLT